MSRVGPIPELFVILVSVAIALFFLAELAGPRLRHRRFLGVAARALVAAWFAASVALAIWLPKHSLPDNPIGWFVMVFAGGGLFGVWMWAFIGSIILVMTTLAWLADLIPPLRRHGVGDAIRRGRRSTVGEPDP